MRTNLSILLLVSLAVRTSQSQVADTPEQVTDHLLATMRAGDWQGMAALMHRDALKELRSLLEPVFAAPAAGAFRQQLLGVVSVAEAHAVSDTAVFASLMRVAMQQADIVEPLKSAEFQILGHVNEGSDTTHVVYRMAMTIRSIPITKMDVISLARSPVGWRGLLKGDISGLAASLRAAMAAQ